MINPTSPAWHLRLARLDDVPALEELIPLSVRVLQAPHYSAAQMEAALGPVFGVDRQLISDGTFFVAEQKHRVLGCGGWSRRKSLFGGDAARGNTEEALLDPASDAARIRAFFVHPDWARQGIGRALVAACESAIRKAGFKRIVIIATLAGEPLYASFGYSVEERFDIILRNGLPLPGVRMAKSLEAITEHKLKTTY